jgi:hypothetical protein
LSLRVERLFQTCVLCTNFDIYVFFHSICKREIKLHVFFNIELTPDKKKITPSSCRFISDDNCTTEQTSHNTNMCLFGGKCAQITNTESRCLCPSGISGQQCQRVQSVTFDGHGFIKLPPLPDLVMINNTVVSKPNLTSNRILYKPNFK